MQLEYGVGSRVDGLYDGNNDDMWYSGRVQRINSAAANDGDAAAAYEVLYDDGEIEYQMSPKWLRMHVSGTLCVGTRVFGRYAGGDEWYPGKMTEVQENGFYTIECDDAEVETDVPTEFIEEPTEAVFEPATVPEVANAQVEDEKDHAEERDHEPVQMEPEPVIPVPDEPTPAVLPEPNSIDDEDVEEPSVDTTSQREDEETPSEPQQPTIAVQQPQQEYEMERPRFHAKPKPADNGPPPQCEQQHRQPEAATNRFETDEYASIVESIELLGKRLADAASIKAVLSTLVKQMRAFPQVTADLVHERNGERLVIDVLKFHESHAVIQCCCFVLLRRLCFLCAKSTHYFLRSGIINFVTSAMRKFAEDAILQAAACGTLAVFTQVHAGLNLLLEHQVAQLPSTAGRARLTEKKKKKASSSTIRESFQVKIESETQLRVSKEMRSPFASPIPPSHKRTKGSTASSKTGTKSAMRSSSHDVQRSSAVKKPLKTDLNAESLTAYAAKLFNEGFGFEGDANGVDQRSGPPATHSLLESKQRSKNESA